MAEQQQQNQESEDPAEQSADLRARFPDPETDSRLKVPEPGTLPSPPRASFERQTLKRSEEIARDRLAQGSVLPSNLRSLGAASTIGIFLVAAIGVGAGLGALADRFLIHSATPWGLIIGFMLGTASGFVNLVRVAGQLNRDE